MDYQTSSQTVYVWTGSQMQGFYMSLHVFTDNLNAAKMIKIYFINLEGFIICTKVVYKEKQKMDTTRGQ